MSNIKKVHKFFKNFYNKSYSTIKNKIIIISCIDKLVKGALVKNQNMNLLLFKEDDGLR